MTDSTFLLDGADDGGSDRKKLALVAGAAALVVAILGYFVVVPMLTGGGSSDAGAAPLVRQRPAKTAPKKPAAKPVAKKPVAQPPAYADTSARTDPFKPLIVEPVSVSVPVGMPVGQPPAAPAPGSGTTGSSSGSSGSSSTTVSGQRVGLVTVYAKDGKQYAQTKVGDTVHSPAVGQVFAGSFKLLAVSGKTATYLFGDEQFTLSVGQEVLK